MPYKDPEKRKEYERKRRLKNREKIKQYHKEYSKTPQRKKSFKISSWKRQGVLCFDWNLLHELYIKTTHCEFCNCELYGIGNNKKCMDHNHTITDKFNVRGILCQLCNIKDVLQ